MKKHLAIICGIFYPDPSATGQCAKRFANLLSNDFEIDIICLSESEEQMSVDLADGMKVHKLAGCRLRAESKSAGILRKTIHLLGGAQIKTRLLGNLTWYRKAAYQKLEEIHSMHSLDTVFSICSPFAAHCAAMDFKRMHPTIRWCGYTVDPYAAGNRIRPFWCSYKKLIEVEKRVLQSMDTVLLSEEVFKSRPELYLGCSACRALPYVLPEMNLGTGERRFFSEEDINCVYAGSFYRDIRNPEYMLSLFSEINDRRIKLHLFSRGCEDVVNRYAQCSDTIIVHEHISPSEMWQVYRDADIMVNIGNASPEFLPSKTYEYISTGKPIISFYYGDTPDKVLENYPLCIQLCNEPTSNDSDCLAVFVLSNGKKVLEHEQILKLYQQNTPQNVASILLSSM